MAEDSSTKPDQPVPPSAGPTGEIHFADGSNSDSNQDLFINQVIDGKYRLLERLGSGGMGAVYRGQHELMDRTVAIKMLHPHLVANPELLKRFQHEARVASKLNHPHAIQTYDYGIYNGSPYLVMEFAQGRTLKDLIQHEGPQPIGRLLRFFEQVGSALAKAHEIGIVHRDLKPENIMLVKQRDGSESATVLDFGIAKILQQQNDQHITAGMTRAGTFCGTPKYASPEQVLEKTIDHRADIYTLGIILYEALSGDVPFDAPSYMELLVKHVNQEPLPLRQFKPELGIAPELDAVVMRCLKKAPEERFQTVAELVEALRVASSTTATISSAGKQGSSIAGIFILGGGVLALCAALGVGYYLFAGDTSEEDVDLARNDTTPLTSPTPEPTRQQSTTNQNGVLATEFLPRETSSPIPSVAPKETPVEAATIQPSTPAPTPEAEIDTSPTPTQFVNNELASPTPVVETPAPTSSATPPSQVSEVAPAYGSITINSTPDGAQILVNGERRGVTPMTLNKLPKGSYSISLSLEGFDDYKNTVIVDSESTKVVSASLTTATPKEGSKDVAIRLFKEGMSLYKSKRYVEAAAKFENAIKIRSDAVASLIALGNCYLRMGRNGEALNKFLAATRTDATYGPAHYNLAAFYAVTGESSKALQSLRKAISLDPRARGSARNEPDFISLRGLPEFNEIVGR